MTSGVAAGKVNITRFSVFKYSLFNLELLPVEVRIISNLSLMFVYRVLCFKSSAFVVLVQDPVV